MSSAHDQLPALLNLLDDPDEQTYRLVREKICTCGQQASASLLEIRETTLDPFLRERVDEVLKELYQSRFHAEMSDWLSLGSSDLLKGFLLISRLRNPDLDEEEIITLIEKMRMDIWLELNDNLTALENVKVMNHMLFDVLHFEGDRVNIYAESNQYIDTVLRTRQGGPLTLGVLYLILAQKLKLPIEGVNLPQHFALAYMSENQEPALESPAVLFYINPFNKGALFTRHEIDLFLTQLEMKPDPSFFFPCTHVDIVERLVSNLILTYTQMNRYDKVEEVKRVREQIRG